MKYITKPIIIEAIQWDGTNKGIEKIEQKFPDILIWSSWEFNDSGDGHEILLIDNNIGDLRIKKGDYIIKDLNGEYYPCGADIFEQKYQEPKLNIINNI